MKAIIVGILALCTTTAFAQNLTKAQLATVLTSKKAVLENVKPGMSKSMTTTSFVALEDGTRCDYTQSSVQTILKLEGDKMIVYSQERFQPVLTAACAQSGMEAFQENVVFFEAKPTLAQDLKDLTDSDVKTIVRAGEIVTMTVNGVVTNADGTTASELVTVKYDLTKSSFKNLILSQSASLKVETAESADIDVNTVNLTDVVFCENNDADNSDCTRGDFSDILF
ncbi:MAG: hypothetical protein V4598_11165 [Bdellovibrionota bacterium]